MINRVSDAGSHSACGGCFCTFVVSLAVVDATVKRAVGEKANGMREGAEGNGEFWCFLRRDVHGNASITVAAGCVVSCDWLPRPHSSVPIRIPACSTALLHSRKLRAFG